MIFSLVMIWDNELETWNHTSHSRRIQVFQWPRIGKGSFRMRLFVVFMSISWDTQSMTMIVGSPQTRFLASSVMYLPVIGLLLEGWKTDSDGSNSQKHYYAYCAYAVLKWGYLGKDNCWRIPECMQNACRLQCRLHTPTLMVTMLVLRILKWSSTTKIKCF